MEKDAEKRGYLLEHFRLFHLKDKRGTDIGYHYHEFCKLLLMRSGSGGYTVDGKRYSLEAGDIVLIDAGCVHRPEFEQGLLYERVIIYISPDFLREHSRENCSLQAIFDSAHPVLHLRQPQTVWMFADALEQELSTERFGRELVSNGLLLQLLITIARSIADADTSFVRPIVPKDGRILEMLRYMDAHLTEDISIERLADAFFISRYHMMRLFRQETGYSIHAYLQERRLLYARDLIRQGRSATESCFLAGFRSYSSFTRAYAKHFGTTPTGRKGSSAPADETYG